MNLFFYDLVNRFIIENELDIDFPRGGVVKEWEAMEPDSADQASLDEFYSSTKYMLRQSQWAADSLYQHRDRLIRQFYEVVEAKPRRVLDYGCGIGNTGYYLAKAGAHVVFSELAGSVSMQFVEWMIQQEELDAEICPIAEGDIDQTGFDWIVCLEVLEHCADPDAVFANLVSKLNPGGFMIVSASFGASVNPLHVAYPEHTDPLKDMAHRNKLQNRFDVSIWEKRPDPENIVT